MELKNIYKDRNVKMASIFGALIMISLVGYILSDFGQRSEPEDIDAPETYAEPGENSVIDGGEEKEVETVVAISSSVSPSRPEVELGETVGFRNENDFAVRMEFEDSENRVIESGEMIKMGFRSIEYYEVYNNENDEKIAGGGIGLDL